MRRSNSVLVFILVYFISNLSNGLQLHDASVLYPLPQPNEWNELLNTNDQGFLLPKDLFNQIPFLINQHNDKTYPLLHVLGVRFDPCFVEGLPPLKCQAQVRLIWQPLDIKVDRTFAIDATLHTFFNFSNEEFAALVRELRQILSSYKEQEPSSLSVHPLLKNQGLKGEFARKLKALLILSLKNKPVDRITFMKLKGIDDIWIFGGLDRNQNEYVPIKIPRINQNTQQDFINSMSLKPNPSQFRGGIFPSPAPEGPLDLLTRDSLNSQDFTEEEIHSLIKDLTDIEHPNKFNPGTADCVTCHLSNTVRAYLFNEFSHFKPEQVYFENRYKNQNYNLENFSPQQGQTNILRMFGYFDNLPIISQRTINETAEAVSLIQLIE
jgi:hypothetical protein